MITLIIRCRTCYESCKNCPASHTDALDESFISRERSVRKGVFTFVGQPEDGGANTRSIYTASGVLRPEVHHRPGDFMASSDYAGVLTSAHACSTSYLHPFDHDRQDSGRLTSRKFHGHELRRLLADVGDNVRVAAGRPRNVAGFDVHQRGTLAFNITAYVDICNRDHQVRPVVTMAGNDSSRLKFDFG